MIKDIHKNITDFAEARKQAKAVFKQAKEYVDKNYKEDTALYAAAMDSARDAFERAVTPVRDKAKETARAECERLRDEIKAVVTAPMSADVGDLLPLIEGGVLNETELFIVKEAHQHNYMDSKAIAVAAGEKFETIESVLADVEAAETLANEFIDSYRGQELANMSYAQALALNGAPFEELDGRVSEFVNRYCEK